MERTKALHTGRFNSKLGLRVIRQMYRCPNCGAKLVVEGLTVWTSTCTSCGYVGGGTAYFGPQIENDDLPILVVCVVAPGNDRPKIYQLYRSVLRVSPDKAKSLLDASIVEVARGSRMEVETYIKAFEAAGATISVTVT